MSTDAQTTVRPGSASTPVLTLDKTKPQPMWVDSARRLFRNRMAVLGLIIIILLVLCAIFAPWIAPKSYEKQVLKDTNAIPAWLPSLFPSVKPIGSPGGYAK